MASQCIGVIGLGLLGRGIAACLLAKGFEVVGVDRSLAAEEAARKHIDVALSELLSHGLIEASTASGWRSRYTASQDPRAVAGCGFVIESIVEDLQAKADVFAAVESVVSSTVPIASNTSSIPISVLASKARHPARIIGMHWGEPVHIMRFMEVVRGELTDEATVDATVKLGEAAGKEPAVVQRDIRGFIANRLGYAMLREALYLLESGVADAKTIDRAFRNSIGWWAPMFGPFQWMDLTGLQVYGKVMKDLNPELSRETQVPARMQQLMDRGASGVSNGDGFYRYDSKDGEQLEQAWRDMAWQIRRMVEQLGPQVPVRPVNDVGQITKP